jgi:hypothetical protein
MFNLKSIVYFSRNLVDAVRSVFTGLYSLDNVSDYTLHHPYTVP